MNPLRMPLLRRALIAVALSATGGILAGFLLGAFDTDQSSAAPQRMTPQPKALANSAAEIGDAAPKEIVDIFATRSWTPPPPPPAKSAPPPPPQAPPLPFKYLGQIDEGPQGLAFMLADGERVVTVAPGTAIDERYRLEKFEGGQLHFLYLPMNAHQILSVGNSL